MAQRVVSFPATSIGTTTNSATSSGYAIRPQTNMVVRQWQNAAYQAIQSRRPTVARSESSIYESTPLDSSRSVTTISQVPGRPSLRTIRTYDAFEMSPPAARGTSVPSLALHTPAVISGGSPSCSPNSGHSGSPAQAQPGICRHTTRDIFDSPAYGSRTTTTYPQSSMVSQMIPQVMPQQMQPIQQASVVREDRATQPAAQQPVPQVFQAPQGHLVMMAPQMATMPQGIAMVPQGMMQQGMIMVPQPMPGHSQTTQPQQMMIFMMQMPSVTAAGAAAPIATATSMPSMPMVMAAPQFMAATQVTAAPTLPLSSGGRSTRTVSGAAALASGVAPSERVDPPSESGKPWLRQVTLNSGKLCIQWNVDGRRFGGNNTKAVSPEFMIEMAGQGPQPFKMMIMPIVNPGYRGGGRHSKALQAWGRIELKCLVELQSGNSNLVFSLGVGSGTETQALRGPVSHDFAMQTSGGLRSGMDEWDFGASMDPSTRTFLVRLEVHTSS